MLNKFNHWTAVVLFSMFCEETVDTHQEKVIWDCM